ncbi:MAG: glycosyltransferase family 4 protein [Lachnospiraceae bacterium]|nr:glycosyltransferase family 4 protein [Lachnospiraceae bacterium]
MTITFISNYINHHQIPFSNACYEKLKEGFHFIQTQPMEQERIDMGWHTDGVKLPYVVCLYEEEERGRALIMESDILIAGWTGREDLIGERLKAGKPVIRVSERLYREGQWKAVSPRGLIRKYKDHTRYRKEKVYLLCAGAYVPSDFHIIRAYPGKMYKWGYFPETVHYSEEQWKGLKPEGDTLHIVWAARFIPLKHPEFMVRLAEELKKRRDLWSGDKSSFRNFCIHMAGSGEMEEEIKKLAEEKQVTEYMRFHGFLSPEEVRKIMEGCHIHIFTSDHLEGWGAVVNEAMNSGCVVVGNAQAGAIPYLIRHKDNGFIYPDGNFEKMKEEVVYLATHDEERKDMGRKAYETISRLWNAEHAADEMIRFAGEILTGEGEPSAADKGPLSPAPVISPGKMYQAALQGKLWK